MDKNLHIDKHFKSAYQELEDIPSADVWEKINAGLDRKEADSKKRRVFVWKKASLIVLLLLAGFVLINPDTWKKDEAQLLGSLPDNHNSFAWTSPKIDNELNIVARDKQATNNQSKKRENINDNFLVNHSHSANLHPGTVSMSTKNLESKQSVINQESTIEILDIRKYGDINYITKNDEALQKERRKEVQLIDQYNPRKKFEELFSITQLVPLAFIPEHLSLTDNQKIKSKGKPKMSEPHWLLTPFVSYDQVNYKLDSDMPNNITSIKHREVHEPSFSAGIMAARQLQNQWSLQSGIIYSYHAIGISPQKLYALQDPAGGIGFQYITSSGNAFIKPGLGIPAAIGDSISTTEGKHTLQFIRIPAMVKYSVGKKKLKISPGAGIEANFLTSAKVETEIEHPFNPEIVFINKLDGAKSFHLSVVAGADVKYSLSKRIAINLSPVFRYALTPITKNEVVETFPYSFGFGAGLSFKF